MTISGKVPPNDIDAEQVVLADLLLNSEDVDKVRAILKPEDFYASGNMIIYEAICALSDSGKPVDIVTLAGYLRDQGQLSKVGGSAALAGLLDNVAATVNVETHAQRVADKASIRRAVGVLHELWVKGYEDGQNASEYLLEADNAVYNVTRNKQFEQNAITIGEAVAAEMVNLRERSQNSDKLPGITTGFKGLDKQIGGWKRGCKYTIAARPGLGKCLGRGTLVVKFNGDVVPVETIKDGDLLMGPDSKPRLVRGTTSGFGPLYKIIPVKGDPWICNWCHVLSLKNTDTGKITDIPLDEWFKKSERFRTRNKQFAVGVEFNTKDPDFLISPYMLGVWLGDGTKLKHGGKFQITTMDSEVSDAVFELGKKVGLTTKISFDSARKSKAWYVNAVGKKNNPNVLIDELRRLFPNFNLSIPKDYLLASRKSRLELLAGLIDTDGHLIGGCYEIAQKDNDISRDLMFLARSLGYKVTHRIKYVNGDPYNRMFISGDLSQIPVRVSRRKAESRKQIKDVLNTGISVESIGDGEYFGFELDGDGRFLLGDFTVTHNTALLMNHAIAASQAGHGVVVISLEMPREQLVLRAIAQLAHVDGKKLETADLTTAQWRDITNAADSLSRLPIIIVDAGAQNPASVRAAVREGERLLKRKLGEDLTVDLVAIDYIQIMTGTEKKGQSRENEVSEISGGNRLLAKLFNCAVLELSQLNRGVEQRPDKRPIMSDLRESGAIEQDSFGIIMVYRDDYYKNPEQIPDGEAELLVRKIRQGGSCGVVRVKFDGPTTNFFEDADPYEEFSDIGTHNHGF